MSYGHLNIWLRLLNCDLITTCWMTDLVIKTCGGKYLVDMDPTVIEKLKEKYPDYETVQKRDYEDEWRINLYPGGGRTLNHVEVDVPPGCYVVWTRVCHGLNEETNKVMAIVDCGEEVCVNLLLNDVETCGREFIHPFLARAVEMKLPEKDIAAAAKVIMDVARKPEKEVAKELEQRIKEARIKKDEKLLGAISNVQRIFGGRVR